MQRNGACAGARIAPHRADVKPTGVHRMKRVRLRVSVSDGPKRPPVGEGIGDSAYGRWRVFVAMTPESRGTDSETVEDYAGRCIDWIVRLTAKH